MTRRAMERRRSLWRAILGRWLRSSSSAARGRSIFCTRPMQLKARWPVAGYINIWGDWPRTSPSPARSRTGTTFPRSTDRPGNHSATVHGRFPRRQSRAARTSLTSSLSSHRDCSALRSQPSCTWLRCACGRPRRRRDCVFVFLLAVASFLLPDRRHLPQRHPGAWASSARVHAQSQRQLSVAEPCARLPVPQRSTTVRLSLALIVLVLLWLAVRERREWRTFLFAGGVAGVMPAFHVHAFGTVVAMAAFWALFNRRANGSPSSSLPLCWLCRYWRGCGRRSTTASATAPHRARLLRRSGLALVHDWQRHGWFFFPIDFVWFWIKNTSVFIPLLIAAQFAWSWFPTEFGKWFAPMWLCLWFPTSSSFSHGTGTTRILHLLGALRQHPGRQPDRRIARSGREERWWQRRWWSSRPVGCRGSGARIRPNRARTCFTTRMAAASGMGAAEHARGRHFCRCERAQQPPSRRCRAGAS